MSMGTKLPSGMFNTGYTQPYGSGSAANMYGGGYGGGTYDPMLGFGQSSGMGTTYDYPTRYSADYTRYAQSGQPFNQPVMGYNTYGQIFAQPQRPPPPIMGGGKGGMGGGFGGFRPQPPPMMGGGKGGYDPNRRMQANPGFDTPFGNFPQPRRPERRTNQLGLNQPTTPNEPPTYPGGSRDFYRRQNEPGFVSGFGPAVMPEYAYPTNEVPRYPIGPQMPQDVFGGSGSQPPTIGGKGGGGQTNNITTRRPSVGFDPEGRFRNRQNNPAGSNVPEPMFDMNQEFRSYPGGSTPRGGVGQSLPPDITGSPFGQLIGQPAAQPAMAQQGEPVAAQQASGSVGQNMNNPAYQQQMAFEQGNSEEAIRNRIQRQLNEQFTRDQNSGMTGSALYKAQDELQNKLYSQYGLNPYQMGPQSMSFFQEGGQVPPDAAANMEMMMAETAQPEMAGEYDRLIQMTMQAILGQVENPDEVIQMFIDEFGVDSFRQLRDAVLKQQVPNAQTEGMVDGNGGGMDDQVMGMIGNQRPVAVSPGEYIVPADVVSGLGDGSSKSGADILDELNQAVRMARTGTPEQPRPLMETLQQ